MKNILIICPLTRDKREIAQLDQPGYNYIFFENTGLDAKKLEADFERAAADFLPHYKEIIARIKNQIKDIRIDGVMSTGDYPGSLLASIMNKELGISGPCIKTVLKLQHKYQSRIMQKEAVPEAVPFFVKVSNQAEYTGPFPVFVKPVKSSFSRYAGVMNDMADLENHISHNMPPQTYHSIFNELLEDYLELQISHDEFIAEGLLQGFQVSLEGFIVGGAAHVIGIVDSHMYPGTMSFQRFEYPSCLAANVQEKMVSIAQQIIVHSGLNNSFFNIEFIYNPETQNISIIEINPRLASQFADLFEKVDGVNAYRLLTQVALRRMPEFKVGQGEFNTAASCVLRRFEDARVERIPTSHELRHLYKNIPGLQIEICCQQGKLLSDSLQDGQSYRYALVHLGADSQQELLEKLVEISELLSFSFSS